MTTSRRKIGKACVKTLNDSAKRAGPFYWPCDTVVTAPPEAVQENI